MNYTADHEALRAALEAAGLFPTKCSLSGHSEKQPDGSWLPVGIVTFTQEATQADKDAAQAIVTTQSNRDWPTVLAAQAEIRRLEASVTPRMLREAVLGAAAKIREIDAKISNLRSKL